MFEIFNKDFEKYLIELLGPVVFQRSLDYYQYNHIITIEEFIDDSDLVYLAYVRGSKRRPYKTIIMVNKEKKLQGSHCSCAYYGNCKHIGAVLMYIFEHQHVHFGLEHKESLAEADDIVVKSDYYADMQIYLDKKSNISMPWQSSSSKSMITLPQPQKGKDKHGELPKKKFKLVFSIGVMEDGIVFIQPINQFLRMDGSFGRRERFNLEKITETISWEEKYLLDILNWNLRLGETQQSRKPLTTVISHVHQLEDLSLVWDADSSGHPFMRKKAISINIQFRIISAKDSKLIFKPAFDVFVAGYPKPFYIPIPDAFIQQGNNAYIFDYHNNIFFHFQTDIRSIILLNKILFDYSALTVADIESIKTNIIENHLPDIEMDFSFKGIWNYFPEPQMILELRRLTLNEFRWTERIINGLEISCRYEKIFDQEGKNKLNDLADGPRPGKKISRQPLVYEFELSNNAVESFFFTDTEENVIHQICRNPKSEANLMRRLLTIFDENINQPEKKSKLMFYKGSASITTHDFLIKLGKQLTDQGFLIRIDKQPVAQSSTISIKISSGIDWLDLHAELDEKLAEKLLFKWEDIEKGFLQHGEDLVFISPADIEKLLRMNQWGMNEKGQLRVSKKNIGMLAQLSTEVDGADYDDFARAQKIISRLQQFDQIKKVSLPKKFKGTLRSYQQAGVNWLNFLYEYEMNGILADDMGLGKTVQTIAFLAKLFDKKEISHVLIVAPVSTLANWQKEWKTFCPSVNVYRHQGITRANQLAEILNSQIILVSYHTLRQDIDLLQEHLFDYLIMDESQMIKNSSSQINHAMREIQAKHKLSLTGTPIENNTMELWAQMNVLNQGMLGSQKEFQKNFSLPIEAHRNAEAAKRLRQLIYPFLLRRKKEDVLTDLPPKEEILFYCEMGDKQKEIYDRHTAYFQAKLLNMIDTQAPKGNTAIEILHALMRMRQVSLFPQLIDKIYANIPSAKFDALKDLLADILLGGHKVLIFSQFVQALTIVREYLDKEKINYSYIDGQTVKREKEIERFQKDKKIQVFLLSLKAGGVGINLTAADYVILFDPWWNPAVEMQAIDRSHRIGQENKVIAYRLITRGTVEEKVLELQEKKKNLVENIITEDSSFFKNLRREDILNLFS